MYSNFTLPSSISFAPSPSSPPSPSSKVPRDSSKSRSPLSKESSPSNGGKVVGGFYNGSTQNSSGFNSKASSTRSKSSLCSCQNSSPKSVLDVSPSPILASLQADSSHTESGYFDESLSSSNSGYLSSDHHHHHYYNHLPLSASSPFHPALSLPLSSPPSSPPSSSSFPNLTPLLAALKSITFDFRLTVDRVRVSWKEADWHKLDQYQLRAYLLLDDHEEEELELKNGGAQPLETISEDHPVTASNSNSNSSSIKKPKPHRKKSNFPFKKLLATITATRTLTLTTGDTEICFDDAVIAFRTSIPVEAKGGENAYESPTKGGESSSSHRREFVFRSRVVRLKLERIRHGAVGSHHLMGFVDVDLAQLRQNTLDKEVSNESASLNLSSNSSSYIHLPLVFFTDYSRHIGRHQHHLVSRFTGAPRFSFDLRLKLDSSPLDIFETQHQQGSKDLQKLASTLPPLDLDLWISAESLITGFQSPGVASGESGDGSTSGFSSLLSTGSTSSNSSSQSLYLSQLLLRRDSLPNQSDDRELKYHESPSISRTAHLLNIFGMLPPGQLFRVSIHFGELENLVELLQLTRTKAEMHQQNSACLPTKKNSTAISAAASVYASFEVKHQKHQPTIFYAHHQRSSICCRTRPLTGTDADDLGGSRVRNDRSLAPRNCFDQHFTFFERFHVRDSPPTVLAIRHGATGKKLFTYRCHLADYITARSVNQFFCLGSEKALYKAGSVSSAGASLNSMTNSNNSTVCRLQFSIAVKPVGTTVRMTTFTKTPSASPPQTPKVVIGTSTAVGGTF